MKSKIVQVDNSFIKTFTALKEQAFEEQRKKDEEERRIRLVAERIKDEDIRECFRCVTVIDDHLQSLVDPINPYVRDVLVKLFTQTPIHYGNTLMVTIFRENLDTTTQSPEIVLSLERTMPDQVFQNISQVRCRLISLRWEHQMHHIEVLDQFPRATPAYKKLHDLTQMHTLLEQLARVAQEKLVLK